MNLPPLQFKRIALFLKHFDFTSASFIKKRNQEFILILSAVLVVKAYLQNEISMMNKLETEVLTTIKEWNRSFDRNDPESYFTFIHKNLSLFLASSPYRVEGIEDDQEEFEWSLKNGRTRVSLFQELQPNVQILSPTSALVTYHTRGIYGNEGQEQMIYLKETNVVVKEYNHWKVIHIHVSK